MKREYKGFVAGLLVAGVIAGTIGTAGAVVGRTQAALDYNNIKISLNGQTITPKDANGNTVEPFAINGTTYLPVRAVGEALGLDVDWDGATNTALLSGGTEAGIDPVVMDAYIYQLDRLKSISDAAKSTKELAQLIMGSEALASSGWLDINSINSMKKTNADSIDATNDYVDVIEAGIRTGDRMEVVMRLGIKDVRDALADLQIANSYLGTGSMTSDYYSSGLSKARTVSSSMDYGYSQIYAEVQTLIWGD